MTDTLREKAMKATGELEALCEKLLDMEQVADPQLRREAALAVTFLHAQLRAGTADSHASLLDRIEKLEGALEPFADAYSEASNDAKQLGVDDKLRAAWVMNLLDWEDFETASDIIEALRSEKP